MKIAVIAANGRLGRAFVDAALKAGHSVRAGVRGSSAFPAHPGLTIQDCDATNKADVDKLIEGQEVVVSCIGHVKGSAADVQTVATRVIVESMGAAGISRYVDLTGTGVRFNGDKVGLVDWFLNFSILFIDRPRVQDGIDHQEVLKSSDLQWTTIRVLKLQNTSVQPYTLTAHGPTKWYVGREEAAHAMLEVIEQASFIRQAPIISRA